MIIVFDPTMSPDYVDADGRPLRLCFDKVSFVSDGLAVHLDGVPLLKEEQTGTIYFPDRSRDAILHFMDKARSKGEEGISLVPKPQSRRYGFAESFDFSYSYMDHEYIPGLVRPFDGHEGYLTPVFFNQAVLAKYAQHPDYTLDLFSDTYGTIRYFFGAGADEEHVEWSIEFGITRSGRVIMWLGDIARLPDPEKFYLRSENVPSDHDIHSQFYDAQIETKWSTPSVKDAAYGARRTLARVIGEKCGFEIFSINSDVLSVLQATAVPVFWQKRHVAAFFNFVNQLFVEALNNSGMRTFVTSRGVSTKDANAVKGLKLLEVFAIVLGLEKNDNVVNPFFVLYDVRMLCSHYTGSREAELEITIRERLGLSTDSAFDYQAVFNALMPALQESCNTLTNAIERLPDEVGVVRDVLGE